MSVKWWPDWRSSLTLAPVLLDMTPNSLGVDYASILYCTATALGFLGYPVNLKNHTATDADINSLVVPSQLTTASGYN